MKKVPIITPNSARLRKDDHTFFVLRSKASTLETTNKHKDIFCVVRDSYADLIDLRNEDFLPSKETPEIFRNANENTTRIDKLSISSTDTILPKRDVTTYSACNNNRDIHENNYTPDTERAFDHKLFRMYLMVYFAVNPNSSISYVDNEDKVRSIQTETEFLELWKFAKSCSKYSKGVLLLVDFMPDQDDNMINSKDKISTANNQRSLYTDNADLSRIFRSNENMAKEKENNNVEYSNTIFSLVEDSDNNLSDNKDDISDLFDNLTISHSKICTKEIDDTKLEDIIPPNVNSQDFLNNDPPMWFVRYMEQLKKNIITEVSDQIMINVMEKLNERPMKSSMHTQYKETFQCEAYDNESKCNCQRNNLHMDPKRQHESMVRNRKKKEKRLEEKCEYDSENYDNREEENKHDIKYNTSELMDNANYSCELNDIDDETANNRDYMSSNLKKFQLPPPEEDPFNDSNDTLNENEYINNRDSISPDFHKFQFPSSKENPCNESNVSNMTKKRETKREVYDKKQFESNTCCCVSDIENISVHSDISNEEEVCNELTFEMIEDPRNCEGVVNYIPKNLPRIYKLKSFFAKTNNKKDTKDLLNFELFPETSSPASSSIFINEDHFTANTNDVPNFPMENDLNIPEIHKSDEQECFVHANCRKKKDDTHSSDDLNLKELSNEIIKKMIENSCHDETWAVECKCSNVNSMKTDVNNSHISYMTTEPINTIYSDFPGERHSCQAQTDMNDLTQSFHSHTTSIADNGVYDIRETNTSSSHDYSKHSLCESNKPKDSKESKTREQIKKDFNIKNPEKKISKEESTFKNGRHAEDTATNSTPSSLEPVHILPEILVNGALHIASFAYGTAREAIVKIRSNSKDDRSSHTRKARH